jgi:hypothetical protein
VDDAIMSRPMLRVDFRPPRALKSGEEARLIPNY